MSTAAQIIANQANALHSTGPRTEAGKATVALNHITHGLSIRRHVVLPGEDQAQYEALLARYEEDQIPGCAIERALITQIAQTEWRIERCDRILHHLITESGLSIEAYYVQNEANLHRFERYAGQHRRDYSRILRDYLAARRSRRVDPQGHAEPRSEPTPAPEPTAETAPDASKPISARIPFSFSSELVGLKRLHPDFDPARSKKLMSPSLRDYLQPPGNLYAAQQLMQFA